MTDISYTHHAETRMQQRGLCDKDISLGRHVGNAG